MEPIRGSAEQGLRVDVQVLAVDGRIVAMLDGLLLKQTDRARLLNSASVDFADWLYRVEWQAQDSDASQSVANRPARDIGTAIVPATPLRPPGRNVGSSSRRRTPRL